MMKKKQVITAGMMTAAMLLALAGCGGSAAEETAPAEETAVTEETTPEVELEEYKSDDGWAVKYDPSLIEVEYGGGAVDFVYIGGSESGEEASLVTISVEKDKLPEEVLYEITEPWGDNGAIVRSEGFFPGTDDKWGYWRVFSPEGDTGAFRTAIAGEYNGGVLLIQNTDYYTGDDAEDMKVVGATETIVDSITYENFQPQTMYDYIPGTYTAEQDGTAMTVTLNEDHTGVLSMQDDVDIIWGSTELMAVDGSFRYEYTIEGDNLYINYDGNWMELARA